jgi:hypothetical protein
MRYNCGDYEYYGLMGCEAVTTGRDITASLNPLPQ